MRRIIIQTAPVTRFIRTLALCCLLLLSSAPVVSAQLNSSSLTQCDIDSFIGQYPHYDTCGSEQTQACLGTLLTGSGNAEMIFNSLIGRGLTPQQAAGVMGNLQVESGFNPKALQPGTTGDAPLPGRGYGIAQWTSSGRQAALVALAEKSGLPVYDLGLQLQFLYEEASGRGDWDKLKQETTVAGATLNWHTNFERSDDSAAKIQKRVDAAIALLAQYGSGSAAGAPVSSGCSSSTIPGPSGDCVASGIVYGRQYSEAQLQQIFGPPVRDDHSNVVSVDFLGNNLEVNKLVAPCLEAVAQELEANGVTYRPDGAKGGIGCVRETDGQIGDRSYHIYGAACDINSQTNNYFSDGNKRPYDPNCPIAASAIDSGNCFDMPQQYVSAFEHHGFTWGGNWDNSKDYMHFEWHGVNP